MEDSAYIGQLLAAPCDLVADSVAAPVVLIGLGLFPPAFYRNWIAVSAADSAAAVGEI
jgi:hypothetical protein